MKKDITQNSEDIKELRKSYNELKDAQTSNYKELKEVSGSNKTSLDSVTEEIKTLYDDIEDLYNSIIEIKKKVIPDESSELNLNRFKHVQICSTEYEFLDIKPIKLLPDAEYCLVNNQIVCDFNNTTEVYTFHYANVSEIKKFDSTIFLSDVSYYYASDDILIEIYVQNFKNSKALASSGFLECAIKINIFNNDSHDYQQTEATQILKLHYNKIYNGNIDIPSIVHMKDKIMLAKIYKLGSVSREQNEYPGRIHMHGTKIFFENKIHILDLSRISECSDNISSIKCFGILKIPDLAETAYTIAQQRYIILLDQNKYIIFDTYCNIYISEITILTTFGEYIECSAHVSIVNNLLFCVSYNIKNVRSSNGRYTHVYNLTEKKNSV